MQIKKWIATGLAAVMAGSIWASPVFAATALKDYPGILAKDGTLDAFVVVGKTAASEDVAGAVDIAVNLAGVSTVTKSITTTSGVTVDGTLKDTIPLPTSTSGTRLDATNAFPASGILKTFHYTGLKDTVVNVKGTDYDVHEQVNLAAVNFRHGLSASDVNGTEKMVVADGNIKYSYVIDKQINITDFAGKTAAKGTISKPDYVNTVKIQMMGKDFIIVGAGGGQVKMLSGTVGTATATSGVKFGDYTVYSDLGSDNTWARIIIKDAAGVTKDTLTVDDPDRSGGTDSKDSSATGLRVKVTNVNALQDGTVVGADVVVGKTADGVEKTYDTSADVASTGTGSDRFPGETKWGIQTSSSAFGTVSSVEGTIAVSASIDVVYKPSSTEYYLAGSKIALPNNYGELAYEGWNTDKFATVTIKPVTSQSVYNSTDNLVQGSLNGLEISSDVTATLGSRGGLSGTNPFTKAYILFNRSLQAQDLYPVIVGYYDSVKQKVLVNDSIGFTFMGNMSVNNSMVEYPVWVFGLLGGDNTPQNYTHNISLNYGNVGEQTYNLSFTLVNATGYGVKIRQFAISKVGAAIGVNVSWDNKTANIYNSQTPEFRLGASGATAEVFEVGVQSEGALSDAGKQSNEVVSDSGILVQPTATEGASDKVVVKIPVKDLLIKSYFGKKTGSTTSGTTTYKEYVPITSAVAKLDSEVTVTEKAKSLVLVGGPCANTLVADLAAAGKFPYTCATWPGKDIGMIRAVDDAFTTGKVALVVAGTRAEDTRLASSVLQNYATRLSTITGGAVEVTGTVASPVVTAA